ncbi:MAG: hypothetical protein R3B82_12385 [Sandaracinaceae bacterium]
MDAVLVLEDEQDLATPGRVLAGHLREELGPQTKHSTSGTGWRS